MEPERIDIQHFDLANEKLTDVKYMYVEFGNNYFLYSAKYYGEEPVVDNDVSSGWKKNQNDFTFKIVKTRIVSIELRWSNSNKYWYVGIEADGFPEKIRIYFQTKKEAIPFFNRIDEFIFGKQ